MITPTKEQNKVIHSRDRVISLSAPGGTGKTETLALFTLEQIGRNQHVVLLTYTNAAADTMRSRLQALDTFRDDCVFIGTLHGFANKILKEHAGLIGFDTHYRLLPGVTAKVLESLIRDNRQHLKDLDKPIINTINGLYLRSNSPISYIAANMPGGSSITDTKVTKQIRGIILEAQRVRKKDNVMDFDDMPYYLYMLLKNNPPVARSIVKTWPVMVVDEFQDTSTVQWRAVKLLIDKGIRLLAAGDPYQTLFRFAGASHDRFKRLGAIPSGTEYHLTENHRSTNQILTLSNNIRSQLPRYSGKMIQSKTNGPLPQVIVSHQMGLLVKAIVEKIGVHIEQDKIPPGDMAVTFRFDENANYLARTLTREKIPYKVFYNDKESPFTIADFVLSVFDIACNNGNSKHWRQILPHLKGVGAKGVKRILYHLGKDGYRYQGLTKAIRVIYKDDLVKLRDLFRQISPLRDHPVKALYVAIHFYIGLRKTKKIPEADPHLDTLINIARRSKDIHTVVTNYRDSSYGVYHPIKGVTCGGYLTLSNVHKIKGKEFKVVFILGTYDGKFEGLGIFRDRDTIRNEIMIMDTAVTRSRRWLYFLFPTIHKDWEGRRHPKNPGIFVRNCPQKLYEVYTVFQKVHKA